MHDGQNAESGLSLRLAIVLLLLFGGLAYVRSYGTPFFFDDVSAIVENPHIRQIWPLSESMSWPSQSPLAGRPIPAFTLAINYAISGSDVWSYHAMNHAIHLLCGLLLFFSTRLILTRAACPARTIDAFAFALASIWLVHPLLSEAVVYTIQRTELLMALFYLLTFFASLKHFEATKSRIGWVVLAVIASCLGMASKEVMVSAPLAVLLFDRAFVSGGFVAALRNRRFLYVGLFASWGILLALNLHGPRSESAGFTVNVSWWEYLLTQSGVLLHYVRLCVLPIGLTVSYDWPLATSLADVWLQGATVVLALAGTIWLLIRHPKIGWACVMFFLLLAPTSSFVPIASEIVAERRMYLPLIFVLALIGYCFRKYLTPRWAMIGGLLISCVLLIWTNFRVNDYRDELTIWQSALKVYPENAHALNGAGYVYLHRDQLSIAESYFRKAIERDPGLVFAYNNLGTTLMQQGKLDEAIAQYQQGIALRDAFPKAHNNLAIAYARKDHLEEAVVHFRKAIEYQPDLAPAYLNLGMALGRLKRFNEAEPVCRQATRLLTGQPKARAHFQLALCLASLGRLEEAITAVRQAIAIDPTDQQAHRLLAGLEARESEAEVPSPEDRRPPSPRSKPDTPSP